jgi:plasmid replication initiation protein
MNMMDKSEIRVLEVNKHAASIHCSNTLSLLQRKISNALLYHSYPFLLKSEEHEISIHSLCQLIGYSGNNDKAIKDAVKHLISTVMEWNVVDDVTGEEDWTASSILASVQIKRGICKYAYSPRLRELFYNPTMYGRINLLVQSKFSSSYGLALYENCIRYKELEYSKRFPIEGFRKIMGVPDDKYLIFRDFKKRVIDKAVEEVNTHSDIIIEPEITRVGKKTTAIRFKIKKRPKKKALGINHEKVKAGEGVVELETNDAVRTIKRLEDEFCFSQSNARTIVEKYGADKVELKADQVKASAMFIEGKIKSLPGFLVKAIEDDYSPSLSSKDIIRIKNESKAKESEERRAEQKKEEALKKQYNDYVDEFILEFFNKISEEEKAEIFSRFEEELTRANNFIFLKKFKKERINGRSSRFIMKEFLIKNNFGFFKNLLDCESFISGD